MFRRLPRGFLGILLILFALWLPANAQVVPSINAGGNVNAASYEKKLAPGIIASAFGKSFSEATCNATWQEANGALSLSTELCGTSLMANGIKAPLFYVSPTQINFQVPYEALGTVNFVAARDGVVRGNTESAVVDRYAPGIFTQSQNGKGAAAVLHGNDFSLVTQTNPARRGEFLAVYWTGAGQTNPFLRTGDAARDRLYIVDMPEILVNNERANTIFAGLAPGFAGENQANFQISGAYNPATDTSVCNYTIRLVSGGISSKTSPTASEMPTLPTRCAPPQTVSGTVVDIDGRPVSGARITMRNSSTGQVVETTTGTSGTYTTSCIAPAAARIDATNKYIYNADITACGAQSTTILLNELKDVIQGQTYDLLTEWKNDHCGRNPRCVLGTFPSFPVDAFLDRSNPLAGSYPNIITNAMNVYNASTGLLLWRETSDKTSADLEIRYVRNTTQPEMRPGIISGKDSNGNDITTSTNMAVNTLIPNGNSCSHNIAMHELAHVLFLGPEGKRPGSVTNPFIINTCTPPITTLPPIDKGESIYAGKLPIAYQFWRNSTRQ